MSNYLYAMNYLRFIWIRIKQCWRYLKGAGWLWLIAGPLLFIFYLGFLDKLRDVSIPGIAAIALLPSALLHFQRRDKAFLKKLGFHIIIVFGIEYYALSLLITLPYLILFGEILPLLYSLGGSIFLAALPVLGPNSITSVPSKMSFIPINAFEWKAAARQYKWLIGLIYLVGLGGSYWPAPPLLALIFFTAILPSVYECSEPKEWLETRLKNPNAFWKKVGQHSLIWLVFLSPLAIAFMVFSFDYWYLMAAGLFVSLLYLLFALFYKYAHYIPGNRKTQSGIISGLVGLGLVLPITAPVCWAYIIILYRKALQRIAYFTNL